MLMQKIQTIGIWSLMMIPFCSAGDFPKYHASIAPLFSRVPLASSTWALEQGNPALNRYGSIVTVQPMYQKTFNTKAFRSYFGMPTSDGTFSDNISVGPDQALKAADVLHDLSVAPTLREKLFFRPKRSVAGLHFSYFQQLCDVSALFALSLELPILAVTHSMGLASKENSHSQQVNGTEGSCFFSELLAGKEIPQGVQKQEPLKKMKLSAASLSSVGPSDLTIRVHGLLSYRPERIIDLSIHCLIPFESHPKGNFLFEPMRGNAGRWGFGGKLEAGVQFFWNNNTTSLHFSGAVQYDYILQGVECRALGYKRRDQTISPWQLYRLAGTRGEKKIEPLANVLTHEVKVKPQNRLFCSGVMGIQQQEWQCSIGTELYVQQKEELCIKRWKNDVYNLAAVTYDTNTVFDPMVDQDPLEGLAQGIKKEDLISEFAVTEALCLQDLYVYISKLFHLSEQSTAVLGFGSGFSIAHADNEKKKIGEKWFVWTRLGIIF